MNKKIKKIAALFSVVSLLSGQTDAHAFLTSVNAPVASDSLFANSNLQASARMISGTLEKSIVKTALTPFSESAFQIPSSVLAQFNPLTDQTVPSYSTIYYDAAGRRVIRHETADQYVEVYGQAFTAKNGKIRKMRVSPLGGNETYRFYYFNYRGHEAVRIVFWNDDSRNQKKYQGFEILENGRIGRVLEAGVFQGGQFVRERLYDYDAKTITLYRDSNIYETRVYELDASGQPGRPIRYQDRTPEGELIHIRFLYQGSTITCLHLSDMRFAVYRAGADHTLGELIEIGTAKSVTREGVLESLNRIQLSSLSRGSQSVPVYIFHDSENDARVIRERSLEGPDGMGIIGRVLRYISVDTDLEYFYGTGRADQADSVTVLNHKTRAKIRFEIPKKMTADSQGRMDRFKAGNEETLFAAMTHEGGKFFNSTESMVVVSEKDHAIFNLIYQVHPAIRFLRRLLRGPPAFDPAIFELFNAPVFSFSLSPLSLISSLNLKWSRGAA